MHPPSWVVDSIVNLHPKKLLRLGWVGEYMKEDDESQDDELNRGSFVLIQLFHKRDAATKATAFSWSDYPNRGSIYGPDFDRLMREPVPIAYFSKMDVCQGRIIPIVKEWMRPLRERMIEDKTTKGRQMNTAMADMVGSAGDRMYWHAQRSPHRGKIIANKFVTADEKLKAAGGHGVDFVEEMTKGL